MIEELLATRDATRRLWNSLMVVMMIDNHLLLSVRLATSTLVLGHVIEVSCLTVTATIVGVSRLNLIH